MANSAEQQALLDQIAALTLENNKLKAVKVEGLSMRVGAKGGISVYGLGRFPWTGYKSQWEKIMEPTFQAEMKAFIAANEAVLKTKPVAAPKAETPKAEVKS